MQPSLEQLHYGSAAQPPSPESFVVQPELARQTETVAVSEPERVAEPELTAFSEESELSSPPENKLPPQPEETDTPKQQAVIESEPESAALALSPFNKRLVDDGFLPVYGESIVQQVLDHWRSPRDATGWAKKVSHFRAQALEKLANS